MLKTVASDVRTNALLLGVALLAGCPSGDGSKSGVDIPGGSAAECGDTPPEVVEWTATPGTGVQGYPSIRLTADTEDADGDLHWYEMRVWFDEEIDGAVDTTGPYFEVYGLLSEEDCSVTTVPLSMQVAVTGTVPTQEDVEFGVLIYDDMGNASDGGTPAILEYRTPDDEGNY